MSQKFDFFVCHLLEVSLGGVEMDAVAVGEVSSELGAGLAVLLPC